MIAKPFRRTLAAHRHGGHHAPRQRRHGRFASRIPQIPPITNAEAITRGSHCVRAGSSRTGLARGGPARRGRPSTSAGRDRPRRQRGPGWAIPAQSDRHPCGNGPRCRCRRRPAARPLRRVAGGWSPITISTPPWPRRRSRSDWKGSSMPLPCAAGEPVGIENLAETEGKSFLRELARADFASTLILPLLARAQPIGTLSLYFRTRQEFSRKARTAELALANTTAGLARAGGGSSASLLPLGLLREQAVEEGAVPLERDPQVLGGDVAALAPLSFQAATRVIACATRLSASSTARRGSSTKGGLDGVPASPELGRVPRAAVRRAARSPSRHSHARPRPSQDARDVSRSLRPRVAPRLPAACRGTIFPRALASIPLQPGSRADSTSAVLSFSCGCALIVRPPLLGVARRGPRGGPRTRHGSEHRLPLVFRSCLRASLVAIAIPCAAR